MIFTSKRYRTWSTWYRGWSRMVSQSGYQNECATTVYASTDIVRNAQERRVSKFLRKKRGRTIQSTFVSFWRSRILMMFWNGWGKGLDTYLVLKTSELGAELSSFYLFSSLLSLSLSWEIRALHELHARVHTCNDSVRISPNNVQSVYGWRWWPWRSRLRRC